MVSNGKRGAIIGVGEPKWETGKTYPDYWELCIEATKNALEDSGLTKKDIDGVMFLRRTGDPDMDYAPTFVEYMGLAPAYADTNVTGGVPSIFAIYKAAWAIESGLAKHMLIVRGGNWLSRRQRGGVIEAIVERESYPEWEVPYGVFPQVWFSLMARRHMYEYGTTSEQLAMVAVTERKHASLHPNARMRKPITIQDVLNSRMICDPLHLLDCCIISDGGAAMIMTSAESARDAKKPPVYLLGYGSTSRSQTLVGAGHTLVTHGDIRLAAEGAYRMAGVKPADISVAFPYDPSTIATIIALEEMGFCERGEGGAFVEDGQIGLGGRCPINTHGGLHSYAHYGQTLSSTVEAVRQLRGECGERQVAGAELAIVQHEGGLANHAVMILGKG